jgi:hypothetical protein
MNESINQWRDKWMGECMGEWKTWWMNDVI